MMLNYQIFILHQRQEMGKDQSSRELHLNLANHNHVSITHTNIIIPRLKVYTKGK